MSLTGGGYQRNDLKSYQNKRKIR